MQMDQPTVNINTAINGVLFQSNSGTLHAKVCLVCDKFMSRCEQSEMSLKTFLKYAPHLTGGHNTNLPTELRECYKFNVTGAKQTNCWRTVYCPQEVNYSTEGGPS
jgi:hypothetical protein